MREDQQPKIRERQEHPMAGAVITLGKYLFVHVYHFKLGTQIFFNFVFFEIFAL